MADNSGESQQLFVQAPEPFDFVECGLRSAACVRSLMANRRLFSASSPLNLDRARCSLHHRTVHGTWFVTAQEECRVSRATRRHFQLSALTLLSSRQKFKTSIAVAHSPRQTAASFGALFELFRIVTIRSPYSDVIMSRNQRTMCLSIRICFGAKRNRIEHRISK